MALVGMMNGLRTLSVDVAIPANAAVLVCRLGVSDETIRTRGWVHLFEHWALEGLATEVSAHNGATSLDFCQFQLFAEPQQLPRALDRLLFRLNIRDLARLEDHVPILAREEQLRTPSWQEALLRRRFGNVGHGLGALAEVGVQRVDHDLLRRLVGEALVAENAVLCLNGPLAGQLTQGLPTGRWRPPRQDWQRPTPARSELGNSTLVSGFLPTGAVGDLTGQLLGRQLAALHRDHQLRPRVQQFRTPVDAAHDLFALGWPVRDGRSAVTPARLVEMLDELAGGNIDQHLLQGARELLRLARFLEPDDFGHLIARAQDWLQTNADPGVVDPRAVPIDDVRHALQSFRSSSLLEYHPDLPVPESLPPLEGPARTLDAPAWRHSPGHKHDVTLRASADSIQLAGAGSDDKVTIELAHVIGAQRTADGWWWLADHTGNVLSIDPVLWQGGPQLSGWLEQRIPRELVIDLPARGPEQIPQPDSRLAAFRAGSKDLTGTARKRRDRKRLEVVTALVLLFAVIGMGMAMYQFGADGSVGDLRILIAIPVICWLMLRQLWRDHRKTDYRD